jgi:hypothetical protein
MVFETSSRPWLRAIDAADRPGINPNKLTLSVTATRGGGAERDLFWQLANNSPTTTTTSSGVRRPDPTRRAASGCSSGGLKAADTQSGPWAGELDHVTVAARARTRRANGG